MLRSAPHWRRGALLIRGPQVPGGPWVPALRSSVKDAAPRPGHGKSLPVNRLGIEQLVGIDERQPCPALTRVDLAIKARAPAGVAGRTGLFDLDPDRVLIAVQTHLDHALDMA